MPTRRDLLRNFSFLTIGSVFDLSGHPPQQPNRVLPAGIGVEADYSGPLPELRNGKSLGNRPPLDVEERIAKSIITTAPVGPSAFEVANYFLSISDGKYGKTWQPYTHGWPIRWNPVIVNFFQATHTVPEGDITAWCAAFVNWCVQRSGRGSATRSASSGSFRTFGARTLTPRPGDIAVFRRIDTQDATDQRGHVGFFVRDLGSEVEVLGGNQIEGHEQSHMVSSKTLAKAGRVLTLHSYCTDTRLHV